MNPLQLKWLNLSCSLTIITFIRVTSRSYSSTSIEDAMKKAEEPPTPPPRPQKTHSRASSLDLNKLFQQGAPGMTCSSHHIISAIRKVRSTNSWEQQCVLQLSYYASFMAVLLLRGTKAEMEMRGFQYSVWKVRDSQESHSVCGYKCAWYIWV